MVQGYSPILHGTSLDERITIGAESGVEGGGEGGVREGGARGRVGVRGREGGGPVADFRTFCIRSL